MRRRFNKSFSLEPSKRLTFDRKTFKECSSRMMRLAPTLDRRKENSTENGGPKSEIMASGLNKCCQHIHSEKMEYGGQLVDKISGSDDDAGQECQEEYQSEFEDVDLNSLNPIPLPPPSPPLTFLLDSQVHVDARSMAMTSYNEGHLDLCSALSKPFSKGKHSTLPSSFQKCFTRIKNGSGSQRSNTIFMKPLSRFTSFMSNIGTNIDSASCPTL